MASVYEHHGALWIRVKNAQRKWIRKRTKFVPGQEALAKRYATVAQKHLDEAAAAALDNTGAMPTRESLLDTYAKWWIDGRIGRVTPETTINERCNYKIHVSPHVGSMRLCDIQPKHVRDMVRSMVKLVREGKMAPRVVRACYGVLRGMLRDAVVEDLIPVSPASKEQLGVGELPSATDKDGEWRSEATYEIPEVVLLVSDPSVRADRRVMNALKALAGLRHSDVNVCRWRHYKDQKEPLGQLVVTTPKTGITRLVPVHPALAQILGRWKALWELWYGRPPTDDDLIVPTRKMKPSTSQAVRNCFIRDLQRLGLRDRAGRFRYRGGHDLRAFFISTLQEHGAHRDLLERITHTKRSHVMDGYTRASWPSLCAEVLKFRFILPDGDPLALRPRVAARIARIARKRPKAAARLDGSPDPLSTTHGTTASTIEDGSDFTGSRSVRGSEYLANKAHEGAPNTRNHSSDASPDETKRADLVSRLSTELSLAVLAGDEVTSRRLALEISKLDRSLPRLAKNTAG